MDLCRRLLDGSIGQRFAGGFPTRRIVLLSQNLVWFSKRPTPELPANY